jgi:hypothetical protein
MLPNNCSELVAASERPISSFPCKPHFAARDRDQERTMQNQATNAALLVSARDAARMLAVSPRKLWAMTFEETPGLPYVRCGRLVRYSPNDLRRWIDAQRQGSSNENAP